MVKLIALALTLAFSQVNGAIVLKGDVPVAQEGTIKAIALSVKRSENAQCVTPTWTAWFDRDNPSGVGDYETYADIKN